VVQIEKSLVSSMSFFCLTAFGSLRPFNSNKIGLLGILLYEDHEYQNAISKLGLKSCIKKDDIAKILTNLYGFIPLLEELKLIHDVFEAHMTSSSNQGVSDFEFLQVIAKAREIALSANEKAIQYDSYTDFNSARRKNQRLAYSPMDVFKRPMTTQQEVGWHMEKISMVRYPKIQTDVTLFAGALLKN
jgi:hypothetical protein